MNDEPQQPQTEGTARPPRPRRTGWRRLVPTWRTVLGTFVIGVMLLTGALVVGYTLVEIPPANALAVKQSNVYLYADGSELARDGEVNRENVGLARVSKDAQHAVLAAEDRDFYTESAVDPGAMARGAWNTATGKGRQSGSTITQQYVKNYYLAQEQTLTRKAKEFFIAIKLDRTASKDEILEGYLNTSYFGRNAYGIQAAAQAYYDRDAADLDPARAAYLAALLNAPSEYDVVAHPENQPAAEARWNYVLDGMVKEGWLGAAERAGLRFPMPKEATLSTGLSGQRGYLVEAVKQDLAARGVVSAEELEHGGYRVTTTIQKPRQDAFVRAVQDQLMSRLDPEVREVDGYVRAGGAAIDPKTGHVVALYGGIDYVKQYTNGATRRDYQVGSTFKPFVFASAVQNAASTQDGRVITPTTRYDGTSERPVQGWSGEPYAPENEDGVDYGEITVREATDRSVNSVYAQLAVDVGPARVRQTAIDLGLPEDTPELHEGPSVALGTATASVLDMARAYATLANHGEHGTYTMIKKVTKDGTEEIALPARETRQVISREAADTTTSMLRSTVENGTASAAQAAGRPAAGKTGTAEEDRAAWFAGYTPDLATVVAVLGQDPVNAHQKSLYDVMGLPRMNGGGAPAEIWAQFTRDALKGSPVTDFSLQLQTASDEWDVDLPTDPSPSGSPPPSSAPPTSDAPTTRGSRPPATASATADGGTGGGGTSTTAPPPTVSTAPSPTATATVGFPDGFPDAGLTRGSTG
ncbi:transglycosylase domain-containing protein [Streptomyces sp. NPDC006997]|uniref:transglycosylase domain-containing protein n=1 Tax=Streptomyces sp. NPDC006997 TaxID=3155356 RepID=UPI0033E8A6B8